MVETDHHFLIELNHEEKRSLRQARDEHQQQVVLMMRCLDQYCDPDARRRGLISGADLRQLLDAQTFTNIPRHMLDMKEMPRHRQRDFGRTSGERATHITPKRLGYSEMSGGSSPMTQGITPTDGALSPLAFSSLAVVSPGRLTRSCASVRSSKWANRHKFTVSLSRRLPLSYEAQCDVRYVTGARRRSSLHLDSGFAPLFSRYKARSDEDAWSEQERAALGFLHVNEEENPRKSAEARHHEKHQWDRKKGPTKTELNQPAKMPELLGKSLPRDYTPSCVERRTESIERHFEDNDERMQAARDRVAVVGPLWNY